MRLIIQPDSNGVSEWTAAYIVKRIRERKACCNRPFVLGLPTGSATARKAPYRLPMSSLSTWTNT